MKITVTATEAAKMLRKAGMRISTKRLVDGIEKGEYPFGKVISTGPNGRRTVEIYQVQLIAWIDYMQGFPDHYEAKATEVPA